MIHNILIGASVNHTLKLVHVQKHIFSNLFLLFVLKLISSYQYNQSMQEI